MAIRTRLPDSGWQPLVNTPCHPEYPAGHPEPERSGGDGSPQPLRDDQTFTLTTFGLPSRTYTSIAQARSDGNNARVWGGMHYPSTVDDQRRRRRGDRQLRQSELDAAAPRRAMKRHRIPLIQHAPCLACRVGEASPGSLRDARAG